jgi:hypothetical protein
MTGGKARACLIDISHKLFDASCSLRHAAIWYPNIHKDWYYVRDCLFAKIGKIDAWYTRATNASRWPTQVDIDVHIEVQFTGLVSPFLRECSCFFHERGNATARTRHESPCKTANWYVATVTPLYKLCRHCVGIHNALWPHRAPPFSTVAAATVASVASAKWVSLIYCAENMYADIDDEMYNSKMSLREKQRDSRRKVTSAISCFSPCSRCSSPAARWLVFIIF